MKDLGDAIINWRCISVNLIDIPTIPTPMPSVEPTMSPTTNIVETPTSLSTGQVILVDITIIISCIAIIISLYAIYIYKNSNINRNSNSNIISFSKDKDNFDNNSGVIRLSEVKTPLSGAFV
jgi:hypothetical protein